METMSFPVFVVVRYGVCTQLLAVCGTEVEARQVAEERGNHAEVECRFIYGIPTDIRQITGMHRGDPRKA